MSTRRQGFLRHADVPAGSLRRGLNLWPPFLGAGVRVTHASDDYREIDVTPKLGLLNRNYVGTQPGSSLFAMTDPFFAPMMLSNLGPGYVVWDKAGTIRCVKPGRGDVFARFELGTDAIAPGRATARGGGHERTFGVANVDRAGDAVAEVDKTLYACRAQPAGTRPATSSRRPRAKA